jgi:hypothetical protein
VGPLENQPLMICFIGGFLFWAKFGPGFVFLKGKHRLMEVKVWNYWNLIKMILKSMLLTHGVIVNDGKSLLE